VLIQNSDSENRILNAN